MEQNEKLADALKAIAEKFWEENQKPVLLSNLPPKLNEIIPNYKELLKGKSLKRFIKESGDEFGCKLIEHPIHKAKVAIAPLASAYLFPDETDIPEITSSNAKEGNADKIIISFLRELKKLSQEDIEKIELPVSVIVKLLK